MSTQKQYKMDLATPVQYVKGVGPARAEIFGRLGVETIGDLLEYFPRGWEFLPEPVKISELRPDQTVCVVGVVEQTEFVKLRKMPMFRAVVADDTGTCRIVWFHGGYLQKQLEPGKVIAAYGKVNLYKHRLQMSNPKFVILDEGAGTDTRSLNGPAYPASANLSSRQIRRIIEPVIDQLVGQVGEFYDGKFLKKNELIKRPDAFRWIHFPENQEQLDRAKRRLKYDELFLMQVALALKRHQMRHGKPANAMKLTDAIDSRIRRRFGFLLTEDQNTVIAEICADMAKSVPMNRLLQGDVGSGKTVVALYAALLAIANKSQAVMMAPTEILASQHLLSIERFLKGSSVKAALITGSIPARERKKINEQIRTGGIDLVVGTVALLDEQLEFHDLGLVVIDEQHKFGVHQRAKLRKNKSPHCLVMTATPIPRTLAMTAFGDLDVSVIKHPPPGRGKVVTRWVKPHDRLKAYDFIRQRLRAKKQVYFVYPRIDSEDQNSDIKAATQEYKVLSEEVFADFEVGLLHGQMKASQKHEVMARFRKGRMDILVSTIVIEVGLDIPNATIMVIEGADRFGLAQLHQLRGRIGRGQSNSYCLLFAETESEVAISRLDIMMRSNDGFEIAEHDLKIRGPGEMFSTRQHGLPDLKIANIIDDFDLLRLARKDAFELVKTDALLTGREHKNIRDELIRKFGTKLGLVDIA